VICPALLVVVKLLASKWCMVVDSGRAGCLFTRLLSFAAPVGVCFVATPFYFCCRAAVSAFSFSPSILGTNDLPHTEYLHSLFANSSNNVFVAFSDTQATQQLLKRDDDTLQ
jgi:hypothetical protein